jgi:hypothetical protein
MDLHHHPADQEPDHLRPRRQPHSTPEQRTTVLNPRTPWESLVVWFLASFDLGANISVGYGRPDESWKPTVTSITVQDGSWAEVTLADDHGVHRVTEGGPRKVWQIIEDAHDLWARLGQPNWDRFGLTVTQDHSKCG